MTSTHDMFEQLRSAVAQIDGGRSVDPVWREIPDSFDEFVTSQKHLGLSPLYPRQRAAVIELIGTDPVRIFEDPYNLEPEQVARLYQTAVLLWGKGSGKDYLCSILVCYLVYVLLCLRDPQVYLRLAPGEPIDLVNVAYNADQAKKVFFEKLKQRVKRWQWLQDNFNIIEAGRRVNEQKVGRALVAINDDFIEFPHQIRAWSRHAQNESYEGLNVLVWLMDEASAFLSKLKRENAEDIHQTLKTSAASRFGLRWVGLIISWPRHGDDFTMTRHKEAVLNPELGVYADGPASTWEINELTKLEPRVQIREGLEVPASLANDFMSDPEGALGRYCCEPPMAREAFFRYPDRLWSAVEPGRAPLFEWEPTLVTREEADGEHRSYRAVKLTKFRELPKGIKLFAHGDPGLVNDSFSLAFGYPVPATIMSKAVAREVLYPHQIVQRKLQPDDVIDWEVTVTRTVIVAVIVWRPDPRLGIQVDLQNIEDTIFELREHYPSLGHPTKRQRGDSKRKPSFTFDHWNSAFTIQRMKAKHMNVEDEQWSRPFQVDIFRNGRSQFYNSLVSLPDTPSITSKDPMHPGAIFELERLEFIDGSKVDHPEGGSKDTADAVIRVIQHCAEAGKSKFAFALAFGHARLYDTSGPFVKSDQKTVDPTNVSGVNPAQRALEEANCVERPFGELDPAQGTINPKKRWATVRGHS
jgi:hypothetical protein